MQQWPYMTCYLQHEESQNNQEVQANQALKKYAVWGDPCTLAAKPGGTVRGLSSPRFLNFTQTSTKLPLPQLVKQMYAARDYQHPGTLRPHTRSRGEDKPGLWTQHCLLCRHWASTTLACVYPATSWLQHDPVLALSQARSYHSLCNTWLQKLHGNSGIPRDEQLWGCLEGRRKAGGKGETGRGQ